MAKLAPERVIETIRAHLSSVKNLRGAEVYLVADEVTSLLVEGPMILRNGFFKKQEVAVRFFSEDSHSFGVLSDFDSDSVNQFFSELLARSDVSLPGSMLIAPMEFKGDDKKNLVVDSTFANTPLPEKMQRILNLAHSFTKHDPRVRPNCRVHYKETLRTEWLWTTQSPKVLKRSLTRGDVLSRVEVENESGRTFSETKFSETHFLSFDWNQISKLSVAKALRKLDGREIESGSYNVLMSPLASREWIKWVFEFLTARSAKIKNHPLSSKINQIVSNRDFRLYDDPHFTKRPGTVLWDAEGTTTGVHDFISDGVFKMWATDRKSAQELGVENTANARRASADQLPDIDFHNLVLEPGLKEVSDLLSKMDNGIWITELKPLYDFKHFEEAVTFECWGSRVQNSKEVYNLKPFFITDSADSLLKKCLMQGRDLLWTGRVASPSVLFENINILGGKL
jgi:predicted Zn-dependent protease